jgi:hypothetical protein
VNDDDDQLTLFDAAEGARRRDDGMARADAHADPDWKAEADQIVRDFLVPFLGDDVWATLDRRGVDYPHEPRALGPIILRVYRAGLIEPTGRFFNTARPSAHRSPQREWRPTAKALAVKSSWGRKQIS